MKNKIVIAFLFVVSFQQVAVSQEISVSERTFSVIELQEDFDFWRQRLEEKHPLLYYYQSKAFIDRQFDSILAKIDRPMSEMEFYRLISPMSGFIRDGHNTIRPSKHTIDTIRNSKHLLPLELDLVDSSMYIHWNLSTNSELKDGLQVTSINGISIETILTRLLEVLPSDGIHKQLARNTINENFRFYYHCHFGIKESYTVGFLDWNGVEKTCVIDGASLATIRGRTKELLPKPTHRKAIYLDSLDSLTALLRIASFDNHGLRKNHGQRFRHEISKDFKFLKSSHHENLIIDLRNNLGGNPNFVKFVLQHLFDESFVQAERLIVVDDPTAEKFEQRTKTKWYPWFGIGSFKPRRNHFTGSVYVLVDEGTFSASAALCSVLKKYNRAQFIGRETGGNPILLSGYLFKTEWTLPHTHIQISPATHSSIYSNLETNAGFGLIPDYTIEKTVYDMLSPNDPELEFTQELIRNLKNH